MMSILWERDERERGADDRADHWAYVALSFGALALVAYRALVDGVASWELLGLVVGAGLVGTAYRVRARAVSRAWSGPAVLSLVAGAVVAVVAGVLLRG
jgi:hypothetical protein